MWNSAHQKFYVVDEMVVLLQHKTFLNHEALDEM